jgi:hypothetical protein
MTAPMHGLRHGHRHGLSGERPYVPKRVALAISFRSRRPELRAEFVRYPYFPFR